MKSIFRQDLQFFGRPVPLLGATRPRVLDVTNRGPAPEASPPPPPAAADEHVPGFKPPAYPGKSPFGSSCPVCR